MSKSILTKDALSKLISASTNTVLTNPLPEAVPGNIPFGTSVIRLKVSDVDFYERNPRTEANPLFKDIKASIKARGLDQMLVVTKRPGSTKYVLAKGGKTRLLALRELASEDPANWLQQDFLVKPFKSESDLLAAHLVENIQRSDMTFWDTAKGLVDMRDELEKELEVDLTIKDFAVHLRGTGLDTQERTLQDYYFALENYDTLGVYVQELSGNQVRDVLKPNFGYLQGVWLLHPGATKDDYAQDYKRYISQFPVLHSAYNVIELQKHIFLFAANQLNCTVDELALMVSAYKLNPKASLEELRSPPPPLYGDGSGKDGAQGGSEADSSDTGFAADDQAGQADQAGNGGYSADAAQGLANLAQSLGGGGEGASTAPRGLKVASGLTPIPYGSGSAGAGTGYQGQDGSVGMQGHSQAMLEGLSAIEQAQHQLLATLMEFAEQAGVQNYLVPAPAMPLGYYMELPPIGVLGVAPTDLAVQAWWFLTNMSSQVDSDIQGTLDRVGHDGQFALVDTGPEGYRQALADEAIWLEAIDTKLGGVGLMEATSIFIILGDAMHPLCELGLACLARIRALRLEYAQAIASGDSPSGALDA